jgi:hypothetical protein
MQHTHVRLDKETELSDLWLGKATRSKHIAKRRSKAPRQFRELPGHVLRDGSFPTRKYLEFKRGALEDWRLEV